MKRPGTIVAAMALFCGQLVGLVDAEDQLRAESLSANETTGLSPNRTWSATYAGYATPRVLSSRNKVSVVELVLRPSKMHIAHFVVLFVFMITFFCMMYQAPGNVQPGTTMRLPPRWDPSMESTLPFRTWLQDLMLWTIVSDLAPPQQCAAIISQLSGAARDLARTLSPAEVYNGGVIGGQHLDPVSYLLHGLSSRFAPLDEEHQLRAANDLLSFTRRGGETVDALISRFDITRQLAQRDGASAVSTQTASRLDPFASV